jgi:hypothetical protein
MATRKYLVLSYDNPAQQLDEPATKAEALQVAERLSQHGTDAFVQQYENGRPIRSWAV